MTRIYPLKPRQAAAKNTIRHLFTLCCTNSLIQFIDINHEILKPQSRAYQVINMATRDQITTALLTEHLRYTPLTLLDDIINTVNELVYQAVNNIETALLSVPPDQLGFVPPSTTATSSISSQSILAAPAEAPKTEEEATEATETAARTEIESGIVKLESLLNATVDKDFDKLEIYTLRNLLTVSNAKEDEGLEAWIMLDHYKNLQIQQQQQQKQAQENENVTPTPESITLLRRKVAETQKLESLLRAEEARNQALLAQLRPLLSPSSTSAAQTKAETQDQTQPGAEATETQLASFAFLTSPPEAKRLGLATTNSTRKTTMVQNTSFAYSQVSSLREMLQSLRPHLASLSTSSGAGLEIKKEEDERHAYIESQSRRAMERAGLDAGTDRGLGSGVEGLGRRAGLDEVRALEGVLSGFGDNKRSARRADDDDGEDADKMEE